MKKPALDIVNMVGITLIVVAIVSAGGLYYTASTWADISEAYATVTVGVSDVDIVRDNSTGQVILTAMFLVDNPSNLEIEIYRVEYMINVDASPADINDYDKYVGNGAVGNQNNTVSSDSRREIQVTMTINPDSKNMERFNNAEQDGSVFVLLNGVAWYRIVNYPDTDQRLNGIFYIQSVVVHDG